MIEGGIVNLFRRIVRATAARRRAEVISVVGTGFVAATRASSPEVPRVRPKRRNAGESAERFIVVSRERESGYRQGSGIAANCQCAAASGASAGRVCRPLWLRAEL